MITVTVQGCPEFRQSSDKVLCDLNAEGAREESGRHVGAGHSRRRWAGPRRARGVDQGRQRAAGRGGRRHGGEPAGSGRGTAPERIVLNRNSRREADTRERCAGWAGENRSRRIGTSRKIQ